MPEPLKVRVGTYNMFEGGLNGDGEHQDDARLTEQISMLAPLHLDLLGLQEATWGAGSATRIRHVAQMLGMSWHTVARSNFYGCDIAVLVRESDSLKVTRKHHLTGSPFTHAHVDVELYVAQWHRRVHFMVGHLSPSSPTMRRAEAELVGVYRNLDLIYVADFNAAALDDDPDTTGIDPLKIARKCDRAPAEELAAAGFCDVASHLGDRTPTVGHGDDKLAYRCDRIYTTLPRDSIHGYGVVQEQRPLSDHRPVWAEFVLGG
ncbi:hypothetical protein [Actinomadura sp. 3N407]|uniref:hypothetical protein n=1 Tax=Actinomadura sp. 3N407 TaxID=3457423 RepID=UPI003FCE60A9